MTYCEHDWDLEEEYDFLRCRRCNERTSYRAMINLYPHLCPLCGRTAILGPSGVQCPLNCGARPAK